MSDREPKPAIQGDGGRNPQRHVVDARTVLSYGHAANGEALAVLFKTAAGDEMLLRLPYAQASTFLGAVQGAAKTAASARGEKVAKEISTALQIEKVVLGPTESGRVGFRLGLSNGTTFDLLSSREVATKLFEALRKYVGYKDVGGPDYTQ